MLTNFARFVTALGSSMSVSYAILGNLFKNIIRKYFSDLLFLSMLLMFAFNFLGNFFPDNIAFAVVNKLVE